MKNKETKEKLKGFANYMVNVLLAILLIVFITTFIGIVFLYSLAEHIKLPAIGYISSEGMTMFFESGYSIIIGIFFVILSLLLIVLINLKYIRRIFVTLGISFILTSGLNIGLAIFEPTIIRFLSGAWQDVLISTTVVFKEFTTLCSIFLLLSGSVCLSIYSCIAIIKGDSHEEKI